VPIALPFLFADPLAALAAAIGWVIFMRTFGNYSRQIKAE
jgi:hypothetical protein